MRANKSGRNIANNDHDRSSPFTYGSLNRSVSLSRLAAWHLVVSCGSVCGFLHCSGSNLFLPGTFGTPFFSRYSIWNTLWDAVFYLNCLGDQALEKAIAALELAARLRYVAR